jgi:hypothetical protein
LNTSYVGGQSAQFGEFKPALLTATGPSSYPAAGDVVYNPASGDYINFPMDCNTQSGNYRVRFVPTTAGVIRAGAPSPSQSGWTAFWDYRGIGDTPTVGTPLSLGPLSVAATTSAMTANGVGTVVVANSLVPGQIVLLTGGASNKAIFMNGQFVQVVTASATQFTYNSGYAKALTYASAADVGLKFQLLQANTGNPVVPGSGTGQVIVVSGVAVASNVLTVTCVNTGTTVVPGNFIALQGLVAGEVPQGAIVQVLTANTTTLTANLIAPNLSVTSLETATATVLVTNGNAPIQANGDSFGINGSTIAATAASATAAGAIAVLPVLQTLTPGNVVIIQGLTHGAALNGLLTPVIATGLTSTNVETNGYIAAAVSTGTGDLGSLGLLETGIPVSGSQVGVGTNLSGEVVQFGALISQL